MSENLRDRYAEVVYAWYVVGIPGVTAWSDLNNDDRETWCSLADAVLAVRDDVLAEKDADLADARGSRDMAIACAKWRGERLKAAEAEVARLREENAGLRETGGPTVCGHCDERPRRRHR